MLTLYTQYFLNRHKNVLCAANKSNGLNKISQNTKLRKQKYNLWIYGDNKRLSIYEYVHKCLDSY